MEADMVRVTELGYVGLGVSDIAAWKTYATDTLGLEVLEAGAQDSFLLRCDYWFWRILVVQSDSDDIEFAGWRVADAAELERMMRRLRHAGIPFETASPDQAADRHVLGLISLNDPAGLPIEIFYGPRIEPGLPFYPGRRMHGPFVTGEGGLGHIVIDVPDVPKAEAFYNGILGLRGSIEYQVDLPGGEPLPLYFMSCNRRQHSFAFSSQNSGKRLLHLMTEVARLEDVGLTRDIVKRNAIPVRSDIGQHNNDRAVSFYFVTPSGWHWEMGWGVSTPTGQAEWSKAGIWGHDRIG